MEDRRMQGYLKKKNLRSGLWVQFWVEHDILHGDINYFTENPVMGPQMSRMRGHFNLEGATYEAKLGKHGLPKLVFHRKSGVPVKWVAATLEQAEAWVRHLNSTKDVPSALNYMLAEWKKNKDFFRCIAKNEDEMEACAKKDFSQSVDFDDDDFDPTLDLPGLVVHDTDGKRVKLETLAENRITIFFLVRTWACVMGKYLASKILEKVEQFEQTGVQLVVVAAGTTEAAQKWKKETSFPGSVYCDPDNVLVKTLSCKRGYKYLLSPRSLSSVQKALAAGFRPGVVDGEHTFLGGVLTYGKKAGIVFQHLERNLGDHPDLDQVIQAVKRYQRDHPDRTWGPLSYLDLGIFHTQAVAGSDGVVKPYHFEKGNKTVLNEDLPRLLDFAFYTRMFQNRDHSLWIRKMPDDYNVDTSDDPYGAIVVALLKEANGDWSGLVYSRVGVRRRVAYAHRDLNEKDCVKFLVNFEVISAHALLPVSANPVTWTKDAPPAGEEKKDLVVPKMRKTSNFAAVRSELIRWEAQERLSGYKFGILLAKEGETTEEEMYSSTSTTPLFESFLSILGDRVDLQGYTGYAGGLDCKQGRTGTQSLTAHIDETNVMFHVANMIPATQSEGNIAKKRHIGNDMGVIIFKEGPETIDIGAFRSQFNHFFIIIRPITEALLQQQRQQQQQQSGSPLNSSNSSLPGSLSASMDIPAGSSVSTTSTPRGDSSSSLQTGSSTNGVNNSASNINADSSTVSSSSDALKASIESAGSQTTVVVNGTAVSATMTTTPGLNFSIEVVSKKGVPATPPFLVSDAQFELGPYMRQWILTKLLNLERMTQETVPIFRGKLEKVRAIAMWDVTLIANGKKAASEGAAVPAPEPAAPVVTTARRGSVLKKSGSALLPVESPAKSMASPTVTTFSSPNGNNNIGGSISSPSSPAPSPVISPSPSGLSASGGISPQSPPLPSPTTIPQQNGSVLNPGAQAANANANVNGSPVPIEKVGRKGSSSSLFGLSKQSDVTKSPKDKEKDKEKEKKDKKEKKEKEKDKDRRGRSGSNSDHEGKTPPSSSKSSKYAPVSDSDSSSSSTKVSFSSAPSSVDSTGRHPSPQTGKTIVHTSVSSGAIPSLNIAAGGNINSSSSTTSSSNATSDGIGSSEKTSPRNVSPRPTRPIPVRDASPNRKPSEPAAPAPTTGPVINTPSQNSNLRPARAAPAPHLSAASRSMSMTVGVPPKPAPKSAPKSALPPTPTSPAALSVKSSGSPPSHGMVKNASGSNIAAKSSLIVSSSSSASSTSPSRHLDSYLESSDTYSSDNSAGSRRSIQRMSSGYDSDRLAASLARQQELMAEGKAPSKQQSVSEAKVAHKAAFNSVKEKWKVIAAEPAPAASSSGPSGNPQRKLVTAKSLSNLGFRSKTISSSKP